MCITNVGFEIASMTIPEGVTVSAYLGRQDTTVPIEASREMAMKSGWQTHEFRFSGHGGPRILMYALEDYALAIQQQRPINQVGLRIYGEEEEEEWNEKQG